NPSLYEGREGVDIQNVLNDVRSMPPQDAVRYRLNRFVASETVFINQLLWMQNQRKQDDAFPRDARPVFAIDRTPDWGFATITANVKGKDGLTYTEVVASLTKPSLDQLATLCVKLSRFSPQTYIMDGFALKNPGEELKKRGLPVTIANQTDVINAASMMYSKLRQRKIRHAG